MKATTNKTNEMKTLILVEPTTEKNGIEVRKTIHNINSCELRKISKSGRDNGYIYSVNKSGELTMSGGSWRNSVSSPVECVRLSSLIKANLKQIQEIIEQ